MKMKVNLTKAKKEVIDFFEKRSKRNHNGIFIKKAVNGSKCDFLCAIQDPECSLFLIDVEEIEEIFQISCSDWPNTAWVQFFIEGLGWIGAQWDDGNLTFLACSSSKHWNAIARYDTRRLYISKLIVQEY